RRRSPGRPPSRPSRRPGHPRARARRDASAQALPSRPEHHGHTARIPQPPAPLPYPQRTPPHPFLKLSTRSAAGAAEELGVAQRRAALLAVHGERRRDQRVAARTPAPDLPCALRTSGGKLGLGLVEEPDGETAADAKGDPVPECAAPFFLDPAAPRAR